MQSNAIKVKSQLESIDSNTNRKKRLFVLDTNVLMHDPNALFHFQEHDVYLPMVVLEELDHGKKGLSDTARNVRQTSRYLDSLIKNATRDDMLNGIQIKPPKDLQGDFPALKGRLFVQNEEIPKLLPESLPGNKPDNTILAAALALQTKDQNYHVTLVTKDINLRIKAAVLGVHAEDYFNDRLIDDTTLMHTGVHELNEDFWDTHGQSMQSWQENGKTFYKVSGPETKEWTVNTCIHSNDDTDFEAIVRQKDADAAHIEYCQDFRKAKNNIWGINARNLEQNFALNFLLDPNIDFITMVGAAGTGKTLLTLAAALKQAIDDELYKEIIVTRVTVPVGEDIGFLPGSEEEKMTPWMGALMDNLEVLSQYKGNSQANEVIKSKIRIRSLNFMRGRTFLNKFVIIDEAQNLTAKQMQTLVTRAGPGTKMVVLGNVNQIDTPYLTEATSGLTYVVQKFKNWRHSGHITLTRGERSRLADYAITALS